ncbi:MAG: 1-acyl-sn-glycerol-3-phosphate acyltransferase [Clostridia bacterium]|nr:1-acyl-sn-glycerol-3-phosphate acyltransferase [Clostridia bacterium]
MRSFFKFVIKWFYKIFYGVKVHNPERLPMDQPVLICSNHLNAQDPFVIGTNLKPVIKIMAKKELFKYKIVSWFLTVNGAFPVDREANDISAIKTSLKILKDGTTLMLFPEGTRNNTNTPLEAKPGVAMIAVKAKVPIIPITLKSDYKLFRKMHVYVGEPIYLDEYFERRVTSEDYQEISQKILDKIYEVLQ